MESDALFCEEQKLQKDARYHPVPENMIKLSPYNCIGLVRLMGMGGRRSIATGILISDSLVLTSAHILFQNLNGVNRKFTPF